MDKDSITGFFACDRVLIKGLQMASSTPLAKLRIGVLPLAIETGRHSRPSTPLDQRLCKLCNIKYVLESEGHFLVVCL